MSHCNQGGCEHKHDDDLERGVEYSLYEHIDAENLTCLNEASDGSGKTVFRPWEERLDHDKFVESDADSELLFNIPFTSNVKLKGIVVVGDGSDSPPRRMKLFKNRPSMTFDDVQAPADQEFEMNKDVDGTIEYPIKIVTFSSVYHLSIYFPSNFGDETTRINYIGLRGEHFKRHEHGVTICTYESRPNMADHKNDLKNDVNHRIM